MFSACYFRSWNDIIIECFGLEGTFKNHLAQPPSMGHLPLEQVTRSLVQPGFEHFQGGGSHSFSGQPVPVPHHAYHKKNLPSVQSKPIPLPKHTGFWPGTGLWGGKPSGPPYTYLGQWLPVGELPSSPSPPFPPLWLCICRIQVCPPGFQRPDGPGKLSSRGWAEAGSEARRGGVILKSTRAQAPVSFARCNSEVSHWKPQAGT